MGEAVSPYPQVVSLLLVEEAELVHKESTRDAVVTGLCSGPLGTCLLPQYGTKGCFAETCHSHSTHVVPIALEAI